MGVAWGGKRRPSQRRALRALRKVHENIVKSASRAASAAAPDVSAGGGISAEAPTRGLLSPASSIEASVNSHVGAGDHI